MSTPSLRARLLAVAIGPCSALVSGCQPASPSPPATSSPAATSSPPATSSCGPKDGCACYPPRSLMRGGKSERSEPRTQNYDASGCAPASEVSDGCCNPASSGPFFDGSQCCYRITDRGGCCGRPLLLGGALALAPLRRSSW